MDRTQTSKAALLLSTNSGSNLSVGAPCHRYDGYIIKIQIYYKMAYLVHVLVKLNLIVKNYCEFIN